MDKVKFRGLETPGSWPSKPVYRIIEKSRIQILKGKLKIFNRHTESAGAVMCPRKNLAALAQERHLAAGRRGKSNLSKSNPK